MSSSVRIRHGVYFSVWRPVASETWRRLLTGVTEDGKELSFQTDKITIAGLVSECDRHSRSLQKKEDLED